MNTMVCRAAIAALLVTFPAPFPATAAPPSNPGAVPGGKKRADQLTAEGKKLAKAERWAEALEKFREAAALHSTPKLLIFIGVTKKNLGRLLEARALYVQAQREAHEAKLADEEQVAAEELAKLDPEIPRLTIRVPAGVSAEISLDGAPVSADHDAIRVDPGPHTVRVTAPAREPYRRDLVLERGA